MDILAKIVAQKHKEVARAEAAVSLKALQAIAAARSDQRSFGERLARRRPGRVNVIAEIKRASPSKGIIRADLDAAHHARCYEKGGAAALSVLTDGAFFKGSAEDLRQARDTVSIPVLRKDFIVSPYQIYEAAAWGADAVLLIVRILKNRQIKAYLEICRSLGVDALVEAHDADELDRAVAAGAQIVGINNRDLKHFTTDISTAAKLADGLTEGQTAVAESGIGSADDIRRLAAAGINAFLVGESLVRAADPTTFLKELVHATASTS